MSTVAEISSRVIKTEKIRWKDLKFIQQEDFKEWIDDSDQKLINSLLKYNFVDPYKVWQDGDTLWCLDGYHRYADLVKVEKSGVVVPEFLPATFIDCGSKEDAAELVLVYSSMYAKITRQGLHDFIEAYSIDLSEIKDIIELPEFSMGRFEQQFDFYNVLEGEEPEVEIDESHVIVKPGDLFEINGHRLICESFKSEDAVKALMKGKKARIVNCDPPYNIPITMYKANGGEGHKDFAEGTGEMSDEQFVDFLALIMQTSANNTVSGAIHYIFMDWRHVWHMTEASRRVYGSVEPKQICVWNKDRMANGSFYRSKHEFCFVFKSGKGKHLSHLELKDRVRTNVWDYAGANSAGGVDKIDLKEHPTPKSCHMIADAILDTTNEGDLVIDWFLGSGTALLACEQTKRTGRFTELEPKYVQGSIKRYINYCLKRDIEVKFTHENGHLTLNDFIDESTNTTPHVTD